MAIFGQLQIEPARSVERSDFVFVVVVIVVAVDVVAKPMCFRVYTSDPQNIPNRGERGNSPASNGVFYPPAHAVSIA